MGNKQSGKREGGSSRDNLHPHEKRRLTDFLEEKKGNANFTFAEVHKYWHELLTPDLLDAYANYLFKSPQGRKSVIDLDQFITIYVNVIRGSPSEQCEAITSIIGLKKNQEDKKVVSFKSLCKYLSDLMESYFLGLNHRHDECYRSWTRVHEPRRHVIEEVMKGVCNDLQRTGDDVRPDLLERWLHHSALVNLLHCYVLGSMYNLAPEHESNMIPMVQLPKKKEKLATLLDISQVVYLNSFLPVEYKETWRLLFSIDIHGESFSKFVGCIVNQGPIFLVIVTDGGCKFGGFISTNVVLSPKWTGTESSFLYKLGPNMDVFPATGYNDHYAYLNNNQTTLPNGLGMGGQYEYWGLWIDSHFGTGECSESCTTYKNYRMLATNKKFHIRQLEVWGVGDRPPTNEEQGLRSTSNNKSVLDQDPTNTQILEMAGREMHSKGFRDSQRRKTNE